MNQKENETYQKLRGGYYTPDILVEYMLKWGIESGKKQNILEPSAGDGQFIRGVSDINISSRITAVEIDKDEAKKIPTNKNCKVIVENKDFYSYYEENKDSEKFDLVIGNPPYIRYQYLTPEQRDFQSDILMNSGLKPNKLINSWVAFSIASIELLNPGGRLAFVLPTDLLQVSYAKQLRQYFARVLSELNVITFKNKMFEGIQQEVLVVFGTKKNEHEKGVKLRTIHIECMDDLLRDIEEFEYDYYTNFDKAKWTSLELENNERRYYDFILEKYTAPITHFAKIEVGITTGNNKIFAVSNDIVKKYSLQKYAVPVLGRSIETLGIEYNEADFKENRKNNQNVWLLDFNEKKLNKGAKEYIALAEKSNEHLGYKLQIRDKWYEIPSIWIPEAFLLRRIGKVPKILKNSISAVSTDTFHRVKLLDNSNYKLEELVFLFYSSPSMLSLELEGRTFGGGALEILPGDLKNVKLPIDVTFKESRKLFQELDYKLRSGEEIIQIVKWVDETIQKCCNIEIDFNITFRAWKALHQRRVKV